MKSGIKFLLGLILLIILVASGGVAAYIFWYQPESHKSALLQNIELFRNVEEFDKLEITASGKQVASLRVESDDEILSNENVNTDFSVVYDFDFSENVISFISEGETQSLDIPYYKSTSIFRDKNNWQDIIDSKEYEFSVIEKNNRKYWKYSLRGDKTNYLYRKFIEEGFKANIMGASDEPQISDNIRIGQINSSINNDVEIHLYLDAATKVLSEVQVDFEGILNVNFSMQTTFNVIETYNYFGVLTFEDSTTVMTKKQLSENFEIKLNPFDLLNQ